MLMREKYKPYISMVSSLSLRLKLSLITIALLSIAILSISATFFINGKRILKERILSDLVALVDAKANRIVNLVELNCEQADLIASRRFLRLMIDQIQEDPLTSKKQTKEIVEVLSEIVESVKFVERIDIIGISGKIIISSTPENIGKDEASSKSFLEGKKDRYMADLYKEGDSLMYYISVPILRLGEAVEQEPIAVLKMNMEARRLLNLLTDYTGLGETGEIELGTISNENILFINPLRHRPHLEQQLIVPLKGDYAEPMERAVKKQEGMMVGLDYRGVEVLAAYRYIAIGNWGLVAKIDFAEIFDSVDKLKTLTIKISILVILLCIVVIIYYSTIIMKPLKRLQTGIDIIARGDFNYKIEVKSKDEIGQLALAFNRMTENLKNITSSRDEMNMEIEKRREAEQKMKAFMKVKSDFTSKVSHELRTPLAAIKEGVAIVADGAAGDVNSEQKSFLELATRNVDRLSRLINDVLDFQKLEAGIETMNIQRHNINKIIQEVHDTMIPITKKKSLDLTMALDNDLQEILCDKDKITQVLMNLVNNAVKFTDKGSIVIITKSAKNLVQVSVKDTGSGIKKEDLPQLFQQFVQLHSDLSKTLGGTGLGLAISKEIIEAHKGKIWVESEPGKGTTISFILPVKERRA